MSIFERKAIHSFERIGKYRLLCSTFIMLVVWLILAQTIAFRQQTRCSSSAPEATSLVIILHCLLRPTLICVSVLLHLRVQCFALAVVLTPLSYFHKFAAFPTFFPTGPYFHSPNQPFPIRNFLHLVLI